MSYDRIGNWRVRDNGKKVNIFDKVAIIKQNIKGMLPEIEDDKIMLMLSHCRNRYLGYCHKQKGKPYILPKPLTKNEEIVYDYLLRNNLNPSTTYRWFLATRIPSDVKEKLAAGKIGYQVAMRISANRKKVKESNSGLLMMEELRIIVREL